VAVVGAGPAGLSAAVTAARLGHTVDLYEASDAVGGQFAIAQRIPGKEEFTETIRYFRRQIEVTGVNLHLGERATAHRLAGEGYETVVLACGVVPRIPDIKGIEHPSVMTYADAVLARREIGRRVAVVGAGGIGVDVCEFLTHHAAVTVEDWRAEWGVTEDAHAPGSLTARRPAPSPRRVFLLQRTPGKIGTRLGPTTGWVHKAALASKGVELISGVNYERIDDEGLHISDGADGAPRLLEVDNIIICAGQEPVNALAGELAVLGIRAHLIGGAAYAGELDAQRAIDEGTRLGAAL
jgi:2,4-dienoyl-CoA reductase (NADPH2)